MPFPNVGSSCTAEDHDTIKKNQPSSDMDLDLRMKMVSKTTFKLRSSEALTSEDDFELMEIPLSPTHFDQPPTPDHDPPSALEAETAIMNVLNNIRSVSIFFVKINSYVGIFMSILISTEDFYISKKGKLIKCLENFS